MHLRRFLAGVTALAALSTPAFSAPLSDGHAPSEVEQGSLPSLPISRGPASGPLADGNGNGLSDGLERMLAARGSGERVDVVATFTGPVDFPALGRAVGAFDLRHEFTLIDGFAATMTAGQARALASAPGVFRIEQDFLVGANLEAARVDFGVEALALDPLTTGVTGAGVGVCVVDTGVDGSHEQFNDEVALTSKIVAFVDLIGDVNGAFHAAPYDDHGHGTHVSGIAVGDGTGSTLGARLRGVAPGADLYAAKVLGVDGFGADSIVIQGVEWCADQPGVDVINLSLGNVGSSDGLDALSLTVNAVADAGKIVVIGAGNAGAAPFTIGSPAAAQRGIAVGAVAEWSADPADPLAGQWYSPGVYPAPFSSRGPTQDGRIKPDIMAPGHSIASAISDPLNIWGCGAGCYGVLSGTSMASPFVAGTVALMLEAAVAPMTTEEVLQILANTAQDRGPVVGKDNDWGFGLLDVYAAVAAAQGLVGVTPTAFPVASADSDSVPDNGSTLIPIEVTDSSMPLAVAVMSDGAISRTGWKPDLEARLLDGSGQPFLMANPLYPWLSTEPFMAVPGTESTCPAGIECGAVGRQETVWLQAPAPGSYFLEVFPFDGWPNNGTGGSFAYATSNGTTGPEVIAPLAASAGADQTVIDTDGDGQEVIILDGSGSTGDIDSYAWAGEGMTIPAGMTSYVTLPHGTYTIDLAVDDGLGGTSADSVTVTVGSQSKKGGGKGGGGGGGGKKGGGPKNKSH
jgi:serine protease AprX